MKTIKIPKVDNPIYVDILKSKTEKYRFFLAKQKIEDIVIPKDSTIDIETDLCDRNHAGTRAEIPEFHINRLLRYVYIDALRNNG